ncbi:MAG: tRNA uridine-5-carboxymethylaminomethyl(34) synthesis enzyme MnmG, partial [Bacilli bacterium]|nr:tRNA uridine-5-carboxymethylaminomethyl(34) synthesis enzyme MnmG [Bacilli bacterium]
LPCYLLYAGPETIKIVQDHLGESALFDGRMTSIGPRYCPSFESKVVRFADKKRHQLFLEPEFEEGESMYLQGFSTALPHEVQEEMVHSLPGLEHAEILKWAYQIEYDSFASFTFDSSLKVKGYEGLYVAGQICGTSGYEEAAGLGLVAGVNASRYIKGLPPFVMGRDESYIGVMIDDLVTKGVDEPYRLLSSRAEYRLLLRHDNADARLTEKGYQIGLVDEERHQAFVEKYARIQEVIDILARENIPDRAGLNAYLEDMGYPSTVEGIKGLALLKRPHFEYRRIRPLMGDLIPFELDDESILALETKVKYEGYLAKEEKEAASLKKQEKVALPDDLDYLHMDGLRLEARQKLDKVHPENVGQASRIPGVNPADISILLLNLRKGKKA